MNNLQTLIQNYLEYCKFQKRLDEKTLKAYRIDLQQFSKNIRVKKITEINSHILENYIASLHLQYQPKTVKRKIATLKAFFHYLEYKYCQPKSIEPYADTFSRTDKASKNNSSAYFRVIFVYNL